MPDVGVPELLIIAVIIVLLFGPGKAADLGGALGKSIREFRKASREDDAQPSTTLQSSASPNGATPRAARSDASSVARHCTQCGTAIRQSDKFCMSCGDRLVPTGKTT